MNDDKGRVHYQLSITGGQAGAFFLALLVALCLAFFFGMKTGAASRRAPEAARPATEGTVPAQEPEPDAAATAPKRAPRPTEPPLGFEEGPAVKPPVRGEATEPIPPPTAAAPKEKHPTPAPTAAPTAAPARPAPTRAAAPAAGEWFVQVLATQKPETADETAKRLRGAGYASDVSPVREKPGLFRVRVGPFKDQKSAEAAAARVAKEPWLKHAKPIVLPAAK
jgi:cell division septation protein DedD